jgi:hypothetical protein
MNTKIIRPFDNLVHGKFALVTDPPMTEALITTMYDLILHPPIELGISRAGVVPVSCRCRFSLLTQTLPVSKFDVVHLTSPSEAIC